jgi:hypothetical protein
MAWRLWLTITIQGARLSNSHSAAVMSRGFVQCASFRQPRSRHGVLVVCKITAGDQGWRKERYLFHAMSTHGVNGLFMAHNMAAGLQIWHAFQVIRYINTLYLASRSRNGQKPAETSPKDPSY